MTTPSVLDAAEARLAPAAAAAQTSRKAILDAMRDEIGRQHYEHAKIELPKLEQFIEHEMRPWLARLSALHANAKTPFPSTVHAWLSEAAKLCDCLPNQVRGGIDAWGKMVVPIWTDGHSVDINARMALVGTIRQLLRSWDGASGRLEHLMAFVEQYIKESGWPATPQRPW